MNTFHLNAMENQPAQKLTREPWSLLPPNAVCATETAKNMRRANKRLQPGAVPCDYEGVNAFLCVEQWPESGVSRSRKRHRKIVSRGVTHSLRTASPSAITASCGYGSNGSFPATGSRTRILRGASDRTGQVRCRGNGYSIFQPAAIHQPGRTTARTAARR
jgi:hypothetical protein